MNQTSRGKIVNKGEYVNTVNRYTGKRALVICYTHGYSSNVDGMPSSICSSSCDIKKTTEVFDTIKKEWRLSPDANTRETKKERSKF